jgi:hypothetical protein
VVSFPFALVDRGRSHVGNVAFLELFMNRWSFSGSFFNLVAEILAIMIARAEEHDQVEGLIPHLVDREVSIVQYTNDTIIFTEHNLEKAPDMKLIFLVFLSSLTSRGVIFLLVSNKPETMSSNSKMYWMRIRCISVQISWYSYPLL